MTHRLDLQTKDQCTTILFQGLLDRPAFCKLQSLCRAQQQKGLTVHVRLGAGTKVETELFEELVRIEGIALEAESPFLARWIQSCQDDKTAQR